MSVLAIDIGLKNLSLCIMSCEKSRDLQSYVINYWDVLNTLEEEPRCESLTKSGKICGKKCTCKVRVDSNFIYSCKTHSDKNKKVLKYKSKQVKDFTLQDIAKLVLGKINLIYEEYSAFKDVKKVLIELQPKCNNKMKFVSHIVYGKLVDLYNFDDNVTIRFIKAVSKLKGHGLITSEETCKSKNKYAQRKFQGIQYTSNYLKNKFSETQKEQWCSFFESQSKRDDLADCFLYCINSLRN